MLHVERIIEATFDMFDLEKELLCPYCHVRLGIYDYKLHGYRMERSASSQKLVF